MTTATDWDVTDTDTGSHPVVTDVTSAATPDAPIEELEHVLILRRLNTELAENVGSLSAEVLGLKAENRKLQAELDAVRAHRDPLTAPWLPDVDPPTLWTEETLIAHWAAGHRDSYDTHTLVADSHRREREAVDSLLDYTEQVTTHEPSTVFDDDLRALTEPVEVSDKWLNNENRMMVGVVAAEYWRTHPANPLDPDVLDAEHEARQQETNAGPPHRLPPNDEPQPEHDRQGNDPDLTPEHERRPDDRAPLDKLKRRVPTALTTGEQPGPESQPETPEQTPAPRRSWWRSEWVAGAVIVVGWVAIIATMVVLA